MKIKVFKVSRLSHRLRSLPIMIFKSFLAEITSYIEIKLKFITIKDFIKKLKKINSNKFSR